MQVGWHGLVCLSACLLLYTSGRCVYINPCQQSRMNSNEINSRNLKQNKFGCNIVSAKMSKTFRKSEQNSLFNKYEHLEMNGAQPDDWIQIECFDYDDYDSLEPELLIATDIVSCKQCFLLLWMRQIHESSLGWWLCFQKSHLCCINMLSPWSAHKKRVQEFAFKGLDWSHMSCIIGHSLHVPVEGPDLQHHHTGGLEWSDWSWYSGPRQGPAALTLQQTGPEL